MEKKANSARKFLEQKRKVKVNMMFRGREQAYQELAARKLMRMAENLKDVSAIERRPSVDGRTMVMILTPLGD